MPADEQGVAGSADRYALIPRTLCFVLNGADILLLRGAPTKRIWPGRYNGIGGHVERGEDVHSAARREILEECGLQAERLQLCGTVNVDTGEGRGILLFVFVAHTAARDTCASAEGTLHWVPQQQAAQYELVEDLPVILPRALAVAAGAAPFAAHYSYDAQRKLCIRFAD